MDLREVQARLRALGFDPGPLDGIPGRKTTAAVRAFQAAEGLIVDGIIGPETLAALFGGKPQPPPLVAYPWLDIAIRKKGLHESRDYAELSAFLRSDGKTLGDPRKLPWCGDFVQTCLAVALPQEPMPVNPYYARNWVKFGKAIKPTLAAVLVFSRGANSGHVGFAVGQSAASFYVLGGNQSDAITVAPVAKSRLLGARWPSTVPTPRVSLPTMTGGRLSINEA